METTNILDNDSQELKLIGSSTAYIRETAGWAKFLAILGFIGLGFLVLTGISIMAFGSYIPVGPEMAMFPGGMFFLGFYYLLIAVMYFFPTFFMFRFASKAQAAIRMADSYQLTDSLQHLRSMFRFWGILTIILIALMIMVFGFAIIAGIGAASAF